MDKSKLITLAVLAGGGIIAYFYLKSQCQTNPNGAFCGFLGFAPGVPVAGSTAAGTIPAAAVTAPTATPAVSDAVYAKAAGLMKAAASNNSSTIEQWSYYFQNVPTFNGAPTGFGQTGGISANLFGAIVQAGGGDAQKKVSAEDFINYYRTALHNAGLSGFEIPVWMIHRGAYA